jgi:hypothetical protein
MIALPKPPAQTFVPVSEAARQRGERSWLGEPWPRSDLLWLAGVTIVGIVLRLWQLEQWSLSAAEAATWQGATEPLRGEHGFLASERSYHPFPDLLLRGSFAANLLPFHGEGWLRLPFAFLGMLTVPLLALVGDLLVGRRTALWAAGLLALHPWHVAISQTASGEVGALFFGLFAVGAGVVAHRSARRGSAVVAVAFALLAAGFHPSGWTAVVGLPAAALVVAVAPAERRRAAIWLAAALLAVGVPVVAIAAGGPCAPPVAGFFAAARPVLLLLALFGLLAWPVGAAARERRWLAVAALLPVLLPLAVAPLGVPVAADAALLGLPALLCLACSGAGRWFHLVLQAMAPARWWLAVLPAALVPAVFGLDLLVELYLYGTVHRGNRTDWRAASETVLDGATHERPLTVLAAAGAPSLTYYLRPNHWREREDDPHPGLQVRLVAPARFAAEAEWLAEARASRDVFLVLDREELLALRQDAPSARQFEAVFCPVGVVPHPTEAAGGTVYVHRAGPLEGR